MGIKKLVFEIEKIEFADEENEKPHSFARATLSVFHSGVSLHQTYCSAETLDKTKGTLDNKPIIFELNKYKNDFGSHSIQTSNGNNFDDYYGNGNENRTTVPCGFVLPNTARVEDAEDGIRKVIKVDALIWSLYSGKCLELFRQSKGNRKSVSVEMLVYDSAMIDNDTLEELLDFSFEAVTILGDDIREASPKSFMEILFFAKEETAKYEEAYRLEFGHYSNLDFTIPAKVKTNAQKGLDLYKQKGVGANAVSLSVARHIVNNEKASQEKLRQMSHFFSKRTTIHDFSDNESPEAIRYALHGGREGMSFATKLVRDMEESDKRMATYFANPEDWGTGETIKIDKSKDSMSNSSWGDVDKTALLHKVMKAKNYSELVHAVYMKIEAGDYKKNTGLLKYPVMQIVGDTAVYNRGALGTALGYAEKEGESEIVSKINGIRKKMGVEEPQKEAMSVDELEEDKKEEMAVVPEKEETPKEEKKETPEEEKKEETGGNEKEEKMSLDSYVDMAYLLAMLEAETESHKEDLEDMDFAMCKMAADEVKKGEFCNTRMAVNGMFALVKKMSVKAKEAETKMCKMAEDLSKKDEENKAYMAENDELKKYRASVEEQKKMATIDTVMAQLKASGMPEEEMKSVKEEADMCGYAAISEWETKAKAKAFNYALKTSKSTGDNIVKAALPWFNLGKEEVNSENLSVWDRLKTKK